MVKTSALVLTNLLTLSALAQAEDVLVPAQTNLPVNQPERVQADAIDAAIIPATPLPVVPATTIAGMYAQENYIGITERANTRPNKTLPNKNGSTLPKQHAAWGNTLKLRTIIVP